MQEIRIGDNIMVTSGPRTGDYGTVTSIDRAVRTHYLQSRYHVLLPDGTREVFDRIVDRRNKEAPAPKAEATKEAKSLDLELVPDAQSVKDKAPPKPTPPESVILGEDQRPKANQSKPEPKDK